MTDNDDRKWLYERMQKAGVNTGSYDDFTASMNNKEDRDWYYQKSIELGLDVGSADDFTGMMADKPSTPAQQPTTLDQQERSPYQMASPQTPTYNYGGGEMQTPRGKKSTAKANAVRAKAAMPRPAQSTMQQQIDETRSRIYEKDPTAIANVTDADRARWEELSRRRAEEEAQQQVNERERTREELANLEQSIEQQLKDAGKRAEEELTNSSDVRTLTSDNASFGKKMLSGFRLSMSTGPSESNSVAPQSSQVYAMYNTAEFQDLRAAQRKLRDAKRIIAEADHNAQHGTFGDWLERSFMGGAARGFAQKATDIDTWDFGITDLIDNEGLKIALDAADRGEHLTKSQQALLDATVIEMAVNTYFGSEVGRGYKAGSVTAESLPFMLEMMINPAAGIGESMGAKMTRYALKRFGKAAVKKGGKKYAARKGMEITGRVVGDALVGAPTMAATTGAVRTTADAFERMNNAKLAGEEMSFVEAFGKAFANTTIENFSEMFGAYFKPLAGATGEGLTRIATSKAGSKIGLNRVHDFIENVGASDVARLVTDFEKHARWNGVFGEYAEEVVGGVMNAIIVGDQTLDADPETGVFNLDQNIDTFLGVSLLGGFMSGVKTAGYRTPKYQARKAMNEADNVCRSAFENEDVNWDAIRATLSTGNVAEVKAALQDIATNTDYTEEQKRAVMDYASKATAYKGMLTAEQKRRASGEESDEQIASEEAFDRGYEATDVQARHDIAIELADASLGTMSAEERQAAWDGVRQRIEDEADNNDIQQRMEWQRMQHTSDGSVRPVVLKEKDADGHDKQVYVVDGNVQMMADGTMVDPEASDHSVVIYDPATGERRMIDPTSDMGIMSMGEPVSADEYEYNLQQSRQEYVQRMLDEAQGTVRVELGQQLTMPDGKPGVVMALSPDGESFTVVAEDGSGEVRMERSDLQQVADAASIADYQARHQEQVQAPEAEQVEGEEVVEEQEGLVEGAPAEFIPDMEITLLDDEGKEQPATVLGRVRYEGRQFVPDENGNIVEYMVDGQVKHENTAKLAEKVVSHVDAAAVPEEAADVEPVAEAQTAEVEAPSADATGTVAEVDPMPMREDGEADFLATTPERGHQFIYNEAGLSREEAGQFVKANLETATKALDKAKKEAPKMGTSLVKYKQQQAEHQAKVDAAQQAVDYWQGVKATQSAIVSAEMAEQAERDRIAHEAAVLEEAARQAEELAKREEQAALGSNAVAPQIVEKWTASPKVEGVENEITLANGEKVKGHYMLVESGAATPSHNPNMEFARNEGFPIDENGQTVNDRDYERDQEAQRITRQMADSYDSRAIQNVPVVSQEGIVLSGNGRTMAGELAAQQGTDGAYIEHLKKYPQQFGFTPEQVEGMQHPRVVFVADEDMPYTTDTFAKFNQQDMKSQSRTEQSVKMGKTVDDNTFGRIIRSINGFDSLADFYNDPVAATNAIGELHSAGAINTMQLAEMMDGEKVSGNGRQMLENMLIGKAFESNPDAIRQLAEFPAMRQSIVSALAEIANNLHLGEEFSLESELAQAINLAYQARKNGVKAGEKVSWFARQQSLFPFDTGETVADYTNATVLMLADELNSASVNGLKKCLALYNRNAAEAAAGQYDIFSGGIKSKQDIINDALNVLNYGTEQEQQAALAAAVEQRKQGVQQDGVAGPSEAGDAGASAGQGDLAQTEVNAQLSADKEKVASAIASAESEVNTNPTEGQKEAGNYKKGHLKLDGYDITIEQPKGSIRRGTDDNGKQWEQEMHNTYGYIRGTEGVDGDHIDVFLSDDPTSGDVFVVDQVDQMGIFDEHKVMYGFPDIESAKAAYLSNYEEGWQGLGAITPVSKEEFKKWIESSHRKTKPFAEYASVKTNGDTQLGEGSPYARYHREAEAEIQQLLDAATDRTGPVASPERTEAIQKIADMLNEADSAIEDLELNDDQLQRFQARRDAAEKWLEENVYGEGVALSVEDLKEASDEAAAVQQTEQPAEAEASDTVAEEVVEQPKEEVKKSKWVDDEDAERFEALRRRMRELNGHLNMGVNPEQLAIGVEMSYYVIKHGAHKFADYAKQMIDALGEWVRPYLKSFYNGARDLPEMEAIDNELTPFDEVRSFDVMNFDKEGPKDIIAMADEVVREREADRQAEEATAKLKQQRKERRKKAIVDEGPNLFTGIEDTTTGQPKEEKPLNNNNNETTDVQPRTGEKGRGRHKPQQDGALGEGAGNETVRPDGGRVDRRDKAHPGTDGVGSEGVSGEVKSEQVVEQPKRNLNNNHAERGTDYAPKDVDKRIAANIAAIEKMQELMESGQQATPEDMAVLRKFSGWGGLGKAFQETGYGYGYDPTATSKRLKALLGDEAYEQANMSRNSAYYTPAKVIDALWDIARAMGFKGGKVLEGSAGIGNILGLMPQDMSEKSDIHAVEIDSTTGNILKLLYPDAKVDVQGFEATEIENGSVDLAITNVPFVTGLRVNDTTGDKDLSKKFRDIHDFCIAKNVRKLREGGIGIFITSSGTLDNSAKLREWIVQDGGADVVGAFRLNNETFGGTGATSDIIVIRKRVNGKKSAHAIDVLTTTGERTAEYDTGEMKKVKGEFVDVVKQLSLDYNKYFVEHPEMMGGEMGFAFEHGDDYRATSKGLYPKKGINQEERLAAFVKSMEGMDDEASAELKIERVDYDIADALEEDSRWKGDLVEGRLFIDKEGRICMAQRATAVPLEVNANKVKGHTKQECLNAYTDIRDALDAVLKYQTENDSDEGLQPLLDALNNAYDQFVSTYGHLHKNTAISFLKNDVDFANILALEKFSERGDVKTGKRIYEYGKTDIFSQRVVEKEKAPEPTNVKDGIISSIYVHGRVDVPWIASMISQHTGKDITEAQVKEEIISSGLGFENPATRQMEVSYDYLSGNVREKLAQAQQSNSDGRYDANIKALEDVIPMNIPSHLIDFSIGSSWIDPKLYEDYVKEKTDIDVTLTLAGGTWFMKKPGWVNEEKNRSFGIVSQMLNKTIMGTDLIEAAMQNRTITVSETRRRWDGSTETVTDKDATTACANKIDEIRQDFKDWARGKMQSDAAMSEHIERIYNEMFNNYVPKSIPDDFVPEHFGGAATMVDGKPFALRPHQGKAVVRGTTQPLLLAHEVGTGKTYTLITTAMEMRRLGTARKPMIVVQNATVGQFVESAKKLYPNAKVLTIEDKDHTAEGRKNFYAKIKYNDWDMIVVPQSVFERIPDSEERQMAFVSDKIEEKEMVLEQMKEADPDGSSMIVRQAEKEIEKLNEEMGVLTGFISEKRKEKDAKKAAITRQNAEVKALEMLDRQTDDVENFDDMGIDALLVDEAHEYKHLGFATAMQRGVKGVDPSYSKKAQGVFLKTQAVMEKNNGRNVVFATGTPISNTAAEIWTFMRYLMPADTMREYGIYYFDDFVRNFGNLTQMLEFTTSGKFKENNRFAGYVNLPELVRIWSGIADTVLTAEAGGVSDKIPDMEGGKAQDIYLPQTKALRSVMKYVKAELERFENMTGKQKKENSHIPLTMYGIAKAAAVDARLVVADAADDPQSETNEAVRQTLRSLEDTKDYKGTVALFADNYQNSKTGFNLYEDIREKLIAAGVPEEQIVVMKSGMSVKKKLEIFDMVNRGDVRVIMGSTFTLGTGVNIQERLHTLIHLDAPNRPMDYTQRNGRILRQGNLHKEMNKPVRVLRFGVEDSLDVTAYQRLKTKGAIADSIMNGKQMMSNSMENRALEEEEDVFGDTVAQLSGSEYAMLKNQAEKDVRKYENKKKQWEADQTYCHNEIPRLESRIRQAKIRLEDVKKALEKVEEMAGKHPEATITVDKKKYDSIDAMSDYIKEFNKKIRDAESDMRENPYKDTERKYTLKVNIGGFDFLFTTNMSVETTSKQGTLFSAVHRKMVYSCDALGLEDVPVKQSLLREGLEDIIENVITGNDFRERIDNLERGIAKNEATLAQVKERDGKPFGFVKELEAAHKHLDEYTELMKKEMEEKEKKYAEMDAEVEEAVDLSEAQEAEEEESDDLYREGEGPVEPSSTYEEGLKSARSVGYSKKQYDAMLERGERNARKRFADMVEKLNLTDRVEIRDTAEGLKGKKANAKGWYDPDTGKIVVILGNHESADDVVKTILHEGVGHHGLRELFGKHFDQFLDNVYEAADEYVRGKIYAIAEKHGYDFRKATEEYLADMAMDTDFEHPDRQEWWMKIKQLFWEMLHKLGMKVKDWSTTISDNELRYLLWRSYMNLTEPGRYRSLVEQAEDTLMQKKLKVGVFEEASQPESSDTEQSQEVLKAAEPVEDAIAKMRKERPDTVFLVEVGDHYEARGEDAKQMSQVLGINPTKSGVVRIAKDDINKYLLRMVRAGQRVALAGEMTPRAAEDRELFRDGDFSERDRAIARDAYERMVASSGYQFKEAMQDSMLGLRKAYEAILGGKKFRIEEVAGNENAYLAENRMSSVNAAEQTAYFREWMQPLLREIHKICGDDAASRKQLIDYMMAKHGLERNEKFAERDAQEAAKNGADYNKEYQNNRKKDYSGLTALTGNAYTAAAEAAAQQMVADFEADHDTTALWEKVNDATKTTLAKIYISGMLSEESYEQIRDMFDYYIPLRGWDETTSDEVYGYLTSKDGPLRGSTIKHAYGRSSKADDPIATIGLMADTAIRQANRNEMKQRFLTFALNHPSDLVSVNKLWLQYDATNDEWVPVFADIKADDSAYDVERKVKAFEARMEALAAADPDNYKSGEDAKNIPYKVVKGNVSEHQVLVKRGGVTYVLTINGNPRAAQALNGLTNPDVETAGVIGNMLKGAEYINRQLSAFYTTRTPDFIVSNFFRDMLYSNCMTWVKENPRYALTFHKNFGKVNPATMRVLFGKWEKGTLDDSKTLEHQFKMFMMNGGETGYTNVKDIEGKKKEIVAELKRQGNVSRKAWHALGMQLDLLNRSVENCARFAAFITSQELGRSIDRSIYDAKEVSVNFNKKGSGGKMVNANGQTGLGKMGSYMSGAGRLFYVFWNAGVQGMTNFGRAAKRHPGKFTAGAASIFALGAVIPLLAQALGGDDDDDKNAYYNLPEYVRRSNICFRAGDQWITIPLPIEFRAIYGMGELATGVISGNEDYSDGELARQMTSQVSQILPLDFMEGGGGLHAFIPSVAKPLVEAANNKGWTGLPIYKDTPWNQNDPEFTKVYKSADKYIVGASRWLNEFTGGDDYKKGWADVVNPAQVEYVLNGYFGGYFKVPNQLVKMAETAFGDREFEWRNMMIANRLVKSGDERTAHRKLQNEYFKYKEEYEETKRLKKKYEQAANDGVVGYAEKVDFLNNSEEYARYLIFDQYRKQINDLYKLQKDEPDAEKRRVYEEEYYHVMREMVDAMHEYEKGKGK